MLSNWIAATWKHDAIHILILSGVDAAHGLTSRLGVLWAKRGEPLEGVLKVFRIAARIAIAWTLLSLLLTAFWALLLEVARRFGSKPPAREERQLSGQVTAVYGDLVDEDGMRAEAFAHCDANETAESDTLVFIPPGTVPTRKR